MNTALDDDLLTPEATADPYPLLDALRTHDPVHWSADHRAWLLTRYDDVSAAFANKALSNDRVRPVRAARAARGETPGAADRVLALMGEWMVVSDPPSHTRLRSVTGCTRRKATAPAWASPVSHLSLGTCHALGLRWSPFLFRASF